MKEMSLTTTQRVIISKSGKVKRKPITFVEVIGVDGQPLDRCSGKRARKLLEAHRAKVIKQDPFTIQMKELPHDGS